VDNERLPRGWISAADLEAAAPASPVGNLALTGYGHTFRADSDSLRAALDATVLSPTGQAVGVGADGRVVGVTSYERLRIAIQQGADDVRQPARAEDAAEEVPAS
jgi:osmoprotectant transport system ATP-binding protein